MTLTKTLRSDSVLTLTIPPTPRDYPRRSALTPSLFHSFLFGEGILFEKVCAMGLRAGFL